MIRSLPENKISIENHPLLVNAFDRPRFYSYSLQTISTGIKLIVSALTSLRGAQKCFDIFSCYNSQKIPCFSSIQNWLLKFGLYELRKNKPYRHDWIYIIDNSISLGRKKCFIILGTCMEDLKNHGYQLTHTSIEILKLAIIEKCQGELVDYYLEEVSQRYGEPYQIVSDHGSDIKKGISLFCQRHPCTLSTYDVTHKMANLLKEVLETGAAWKIFQKQCAETRNLVLQTELAYLMPPQQKVKSRYLNVKSLIEWRDKIVRYKKENKYKELKPVYRVDEKILQKNFKLTRKQIRRAKSLSHKYYHDREEFLKLLEKFIDKEELHHMSTELLCQLDVSEDRFNGYFKWVEKNEDEFIGYKEVIMIIETVEKQLKKEGLSRDSDTKCLEKLSTLDIKTSTAKIFLEKVMHYLEDESSQIKQNDNLLATSDIIESIFGKYKFFETRSSMKGIGKMILSIPAFCAEITPKKIKDALECIHQLDIRNWINENCGKSLLAMRKELLN